MIAFAVNLAGYSTSIEGDKTSSSYKTAIDEAVSRLCYEIVMAQEIYARYPWDERTLEFRFRAMEDVLDNERLYLISVFEEDDVSEEEDDVFEELTRFYKKVGTVLVLSGHRTGHGC